MKDQILESYVDAFSDAEGFSALSDSERFERFVNYCVVSRQYPRGGLDIEGLSVGGADDIGIDGIAITVNGTIVQSEEEVDFLKQQNGYVDASFTFIQSKSSPKFKGEQVATLLFGAKSFFDESPAIPECEDISRFRRIKDRIYKNSIDFLSSPKLLVCFVTAGEWKEPAPIVGRARRELSELESKGIFSVVDIGYYDAERLKDMYRELRRKTVKEVDFPNRVALPEIPGVRQSFVGTLAAKEYVRLISDSDGNLQKNLFEDNVRDYQGENKVNADIKSTLTDANLQAALAVLNNGITIIAKKVDPVGARLKLTDFQVVNGCQSSHVLYEQRQALNVGTHVIVRLIETTDQELAVKVVKATNKQTLVMDEAFESLAPFHKDLEEFYKACSSKVGSPLFYERRSRQYEGSSSVNPVQVVSLAAQINAYVATVLGQPHSTHRYYGELLNSNRNRIFRQSDNKEPYYLASLMFNRLDRCFRSGKLPKSMKGFRFQILYMAHSYNEILRKGKSGYAFSDALATYDDEEQYLAVFSACSVLVDKVLRAMQLTVRDAVRSKEFSNALKTAFVSEAQVESL